jgi:hypothetical protein
VEDGWHGRIVSGVKCEQCGDPLPALARRNRRYCDARCRRRAHEERHAPAPELAPVVPVAAITDDEHVQELLARVLAEERLIAQVAAAAKTNWRASAWLLERRYPERWAAPPRRADDELPPVVAEHDPFWEVDQLAAKRRARRNRE